jgi:DNA-binding MarR family transcriptional regulator
MIDVGYDTGFTRDFGDSGLFGAGRPNAGTLSTRTAAPGPDQGLAMPGGDEQVRPEPVTPNGNGGGPVLPTATPGHDRSQADFANLDLAALQALAGSGEPAAAIARQVADMAQGLAALADKLVGQPQPSSSADVAEADCIAFLEGQFRIRRLRARHLPGLSLGEPAWDILLDLAVAHYWRRETSVTSLCIAADVPSTTALRWINGMTKAGLIVRRPCQRDGRRSFLGISADSYQAMLALASDALRTGDRVRARYQRSAAA